MSFSDYITSGGKKICKEHYIHLVQAARSDGKISSGQMIMLQKKGRKFGLTEPEIELIIESEMDHPYNPPYSLRGKFVHLYNIADIILDDKVITEEEMKIIRRFAIEAGFDDKTIDRLIALLFEGIRNGIEEVELFREFKRKHLFRE